MVFWILAAGAFAGWLIVPLVLGWADRGTTKLSQCPTACDESLPRLSIVVPALNEETTIGAAMKTLLALDYPSFEIIAVNDRSTDRTGEILDSLAGADSRLRVVHIGELPAGWLGKNHALNEGAKLAAGEWILFTDADVHFMPDAMRRAVGFAVRDNLDHLVAFPELEVHGFWEKLHSSFFAVMFTLYARPWLARNPRSKAHIGVGAFNLVKTETYRAIGGHAALPMDVADDMKLGKRIKQNGGRQDYVAANDVLRVRWFVGFRGALDSLTKNAFAGQNFKPFAVMASVIAIFCGCVWPAVGLFAGPLPARLLCAGAILGMGATPGRLHIAPRIGPQYGVCYSLGALLFIAILMRSMLFTYRDGGITWRGTLYPLDELRRGIV